MNPLTRTEGLRVARTPTAALAIQRRYIRLRQVGAAATAAAVLILPTLTVAAGPARRPHPPIGQVPRPANALRPQSVRPFPVQPHAMQKPAPPPRAQPRMPQPTSGQTKSQYDITPNAGPLGANRSAQALQSSAPIANPGQGSASSAPAPQRLRRIPPPLDRQANPGPQVNARSALNAPVMKNDDPTKGTGAHKKNGRRDTLPKKDGA